MVCKRCDKMRLKWMKSEMESCGVASAGGGEEVDLERMGGIGRSSLKDVLVEGEGGGSVGKVMNIISEVTALCESVGAQSKERE